MMFIHNIILKIRQLSNNSRIIAYNVAASFLIKGVSMIISLISTPLYISYFSDLKILGIWYTLLSILSWFLSFDLGIGNGLRNKLVEDLVKRDFVSARKTISSAFSSIGVITIILFIFGYLLINKINLYWLFNIDDNVVSYQTLYYSALCVFVSIMLSFFLSLTSGIFYALQKSSINNLIALIISVLQLLFLFFFEFEDINDALINISIAFIFISNLPKLIGLVVIFITELRLCIPSIKFVDRNYVKATMNIGIMFFICQMLYLMIAHTNESIITYFYGASSTSEYTFYYRLTTVFSMVLSLAFAPIWSVVTKAQTEGNFVWLYNLYEKFKYIAAGFLLMQLLLVPFMPVLMDIWLGKDVIDVNYLTAVSFACFGLAFVYTSMLSTLGNGLSMLKVQVISYLVAIILKVILLALFADQFNWNFVVWVNTLILIPYIFAQSIILRNYFKAKLCS